MQFSLRVLSQFSMATVFQGVVFGCNHFLGYFTLVAGPTSVWLLFSLVADFQGCCRFSGVAYFRSRCRLFNCGSYSVLATGSCSMFFGRWFSFWLMCSLCCFTVVLLFSCGIVQQCLSLLILLLIVIFVR